MEWIKLQPSDEKFSISVKILDSKVYISIADTAGNEEEESVDLCVDMQLPKGKQIQEC